MELAPVKVGGYCMRLRTSKNGSRFGRAHRNKGEQNDGECWVLAFTVLPLHLRLHVTPPAVVHVVYVAAAQMGELLVVAAAVVNDEEEEDVGTAAVVVEVVVDGEVDFEIGKWIWMTSRLCEEKIEEKRNQSL